MTNKEIAQEIFDHISAKGFKIKNIQYSYGHFNYEVYEDGIVEFEIKGLHGWKFAMYIRKSVKFFCQHELNIDKFGPESSFFLDEIPIEYIDPMYSRFTMCTDFRCTQFMYTDRIINIIRMIKRHPFISFVYDASGYELYSRSFMGCYLAIKAISIQYAISDWWYDVRTAIHHGFKVPFLNTYKIVENARLINRCKKFKTYPKYCMMIKFKVLFDNREDQIKAENAVLNKWFPKKHYNNLNMELRRDQIGDGYAYTEVRM